MGGGEEKAEFKISLTPRAYRNLARLLKIDEDLAGRISEKIDSLEGIYMIAERRFIAKINIRSSKIWQD